MATEHGAVCEVVFFDRLENSAGYCRYLAERLSEASLQPLLSGGELSDRLVQEGHAHGCDSSCYDCLRDYNNADLHALLGWRLGLDLARLAEDAQAHMDIHAPYCQPLAEQVARSLERVVGQNATIAQMEGSWILHVKGQVRAVLTYPLWSPHHPHLTRLAARLRVAATALRRCTLFDALHRPGWYVKQQGMCRQEPGALVAVKERMVLHNPETQCRSEVEKRRIVAIGKQVLRPIHGTIEQGHISDTEQTAEDDNRLIVYGQDHLPGEPL